MDGRALRELLNQRCDWLYDCVATFPRGAGHQLPTMFADRRSVVIDGVTITVTEQIEATYSILTRLTLAIFRSVSAQPDDLEPLLKRIEYSGKFSRVKACGWDVTCATRWVVELPTTLAHAFMPQTFLDRTLDLAETWRGHIESRTAANSLTLMNTWPPSEVEHVRMQMNSELNWVLPDDFHVPEPPAGTAHFREKIGPKLADVDELPVFDGGEDWESFEQLASRYEAVRLKPPAKSYIANLRGKPVRCEGEVLELRNGLVCGRDTSGNEEYMYSIPFTSAVIAKKIRTRK